MPQPVNVHYIFTEHPTRYENGYFGAQQIFEKYPATTAVFAITDMVAVGVIHAAHETNVRIPDDLSVLGYDDIPLVVLHPAPVKHDCSTYQIDG